MIDLIYDRVYDTHGSNHFIPVPSICVINGHAFGAGFILALAHDVRYMRKDRGLCVLTKLKLA